jgi:hypothetical protein
MQGAVEVHLPFGGNTSANESRTLGAASFVNKTPPETSAARGYFLTLEGGVRKYVALSHDDSSKRPMRALALMLPKETPGAA